MNNDEIRRIIMELRAKIERIDERTEQMLKRMDRYNGIISVHEERINCIAQTTEKHSTYFKIIGGTIAILLTIISMLISIMDKLTGRG